MGRPPRGGRPSAASANLQCYPMSSVRLLDQFRISAAMRPYVSRVRLRGSDFAKARRAKSRLADKSSRASTKPLAYEMTVHQFRHAAGALILKYRPGEHELVRQLLCHRNVQTTSTPTSAWKTSRRVRFWKIVAAHMGDDRETNE